MTRRLLISGTLSFDSGKTEISLQLARSLREDGVAVEYFKPLSGHSYWYKHEHTMYCIREAKLISNDVSRLREVTESKLTPYVTNPVHSLYVPARLSRPDEIVHNTLALSGWDAVLTLRRISQVSGEEIESVMLVAEKLIDSGLLMITAEEVDALTRDARRVTVNSLEEVQAFEEAALEPAISGAYEQVEESAEYVIIESFNDSAWPWEGLDQVDMVLVIGPGQMFVYNAEKYRKAVFYMHKGHSPVRSVTLREMADLLKPIKRIELKPGQVLEDKDLEQVFGNDEQNV